MKVVEIPCSSELHSECNLLDALDLRAESLKPEFRLTDLMTAWDCSELKMDCGDYLQSEMERLCNIVSNLNNYYMQKSSIFNRNFKLLFNANKYQNLTGTPGHNQTHLGWVSPVDYRFGRLMFYITFGIGFTCAYLDPAVLHEAFGHFKQPPRYVLGFGKGLAPEEKQLNQQVLARHHAEEQLEHFKHSLTSYDGK